MKRWICASVLALAALAFAAAGLADNGHKSAKTTKFTFTFTNTDNGSCGGAPWATLHEKRTFVVKDRGNGTFRLRRIDRGTFLTIGGASPGACETTDTHHGHLVRTGVKGKFGGYIVGTVTATSFNPKATCADVSVCETREGFLQTYFTGATYSCDENSTDCKFKFSYTAPRKGANNVPKLKFNQWIDRGTGAGTMLHEIFKGDIANS